MYPSELTGLEFSGVYIHEPGSVLSNLLIVIACILFLAKLKPIQTQFAKNWKLFIGILGLAAFGGMISHGIPTYLGRTGFYIVWALKGILVPLANVYAIKGALSSEQNSKYGRLIWIKVILASIALCVVYNFVPAIVDLLISYIVILIVSFKKKDMKQYAWIYYSFLFAFLTGLLFPFKVDIDPIWFNHKDLAHLFAVISLWLIYRAVRVDGREVSLS